MNFRLLVALISLAAASSQAIAAEPKIRVTGIFSDMTYVAEAGDLVGLEVFIGYEGGNRYFALVQCAEGSPSKPQLVQVQVDGLSVQFSLLESESSHCPNALFIGKVSKTALRGQFQGKGEPFTLRRKQSYWQ